jgi:hypothetical protein
MTTYINPGKMDGYFPLTYEYSIPREGWMLMNAVRHLEDGGRPYYVALTEGSSKATVFIKPVSPMGVGDE